MWRNEGQVCRERKGKSLMNMQRYISQKKCMKRMGKETKKPHKVSRKNEMANSEGVCPCLRIGRNLSETRQRHSTTPGHLNHRSPYRCKINIRCWQRIGFLGLPTIFWFRIRKSTKTKCTQPLRIKGNTSLAGVATSQHDPIHLAILLLRSL